MPYPRPSSFGDFRSWGDALIREIQKVQRDPAGEFLNATPVLLAPFGVSPTGNLGVARATTSGILMYDPDTETVRISINGQWYYLVPQATYP